MRRTFPGPVSSTTGYEVGAGDDRQSIINEDGEFLGNVGNADETVSMYGLLYGDALYTITATAKANLYKTYGVSANGWRLFYTSATNELVFVSEAGYAVITMASLTANAT